MAPCAWFWLLNYQKWDFFILVSQLLLMIGLFCFVLLVFVLFLLGCNCLIVKQVRTLPGINLSKCSQNCRTLPVKTYTSLERC